MTGLFFWGSKVTQRLLQAQRKRPCVKTKGLQFAPEMRHGQRIGLCYQTILVRVVFHQRGHKCLFYFRRVVELGFVVTGKSCLVLRVFGIGSRRVQVDKNRHLQRTTRHGGNCQAQLNILA